MPEINDLKNSQAVIDELSNEKKTSQNKQSDSQHSFGSLSNDGNDMVEKSNAQIIQKGSEMLEDAKEKTKQSAVVRCDAERVTTSSEMETYIIKCKALEKESNEWRGKFEKCNAELQEARRDPEAIGFYRQGDVNHESRPQRAEGREKRVKLADVEIEKEKLLFQLKEKEREIEKLKRNNVREKEHMTSRKRIDSLTPKLEVGAIDLKSILEGKGIADQEDGCLRSCSDKRDASDANGSEKEAEIVKANNADLEGKLREKGEQIKAAREEIKANLVSREKEVSDLQKENATMRESLEEMSNSLRDIRRKGEAIEVELEKELEKATKENRELERSSEDQKQQLSYQLDQALKANVEIVDSCMKLERILKEKDELIGILNTKVKERGVEGIPRNNTEATSLKEQEEIWQKRVDELSVKLADAEKEVQSVSEDALRDFEELTRQNGALKRYLDEANEIIERKDPLVEQHLENSSELLRVVEERNRMIRERNACIDEIQKDNERLQCEAQYMRDSIMVLGRKIKMLERRNATLNKGKVQHKIGVDLKEVSSDVFPSGSGTNEGKSNLENEREELQKHKEKLVIPQRTPISICYNPLSQCFYFKLVIFENTKHMPYEFDKIFNST